MDQQVSSQLINTYNWATTSDTGMLAQILGLNNNNNNKQICIAP